MNQAERTTRVEVEVIALKDSLDQHKAVVEKQFVDVNDKLDALLALRNKGAGVFWLVTSFMGAGVIGGAAQLFHYLFGVK